MFCVCYWLDKLAIIKKVKHKKETLWKKLQSKKYLQDKL